MLGSPALCSCSGPLNLSACMVHRLSAGQGRTSMGRFRAACPGLAIWAAKVSLNWDQAMRPQGRMSPLNGSPGSSWLFTRNPWGLHTLLALSFLWSCASLRLLTYLQAGFRVRGKVLMWNVCLELTGREEKAVRKQRKGCQSWRGAPGWGELRGYEPHADMERDVGQALRRQALRQEAA